MVLICISLLNELGTFLYTFFCEVTIQVCSFLFGVVFFWLIYSFFCFPDGVILWIYMLHMSSLLAYGVPFHSLNAFKKWTEVLTFMSIVLHFKVVFVCGVIWDKVNLWACGHALTCPSTICWKECPFPNKLSFLYLWWNLIVHVFYLFDVLSVLTPVAYRLGNYSFTISLRIRYS